MESPGPVSRYVARNSKKRVFSSSVFKDVEVLEIPPPPPITRASKPKSSKQKEVICHEIIEVDIEEDDGDVSLHNDENSKGKKSLSNSLAGFGNLAGDGSGSDIQKSKHVSIEDFNSNLFYGEDEWIDTYYDDIVYEDYSVLESHFDHMDFPPGVEAPFPWLSSSHQIDPEATDMTTSSSSKKRNQADEITMKKLSSKWPQSGPGFEITTSSSSTKPYLASQTSVGPLHPGNASSSRKSKRSRVNSKHYQISPDTSFASSVNNQSGYPTLSMSASAPVMGINTPIWLNLPPKMLEPPPIGSSTVMNGGGFTPLVQDYSYNQSAVTSAGVEQRNIDEILQHFALFKKFDTVEDYSDHHYAKHASSAKLAPKNWAKKVQEEWKILEKDLPDTIFVRVYESRMDLLRAVIVGAEGTPYHDGLFFFDVFFPSNYPNVPPKVNYHSGGLRINPNLYNCGKVCLSLLGTWSGHGEEKWQPGKSTMLQVLVSIQGLILNAKPYFNEPGYVNLGGTKHGEEKSLEYNERTFLYSLQTMVYTMRRPPKYFEAYVVGHFCKVSREILVSCKAYINGAQVGCLVKGGIQDVDEGDKSCSEDFKNHLAAYVATLINAFTQIGAKDCEEFLSLSQKQPAIGNRPGPVNFYM